MPHKPHPSLFRACDIRGVYQDTLFDQDAYHIGRRFTELLQETVPHPKIVIGYDGRTSSPALTKALIEGIQDQGGRVIIIGCVPTPALYFAEYTYPEVHAGIMVTGSHNPPTHNGFKFVVQKNTFFGDAIQALKIPFQQKPPQQHNAIETCDITQEYIHAVLSRVNIQKPLKVVWDTGNGACGPLLKALVNHLPGDHLLINERVDGTFPAHHPDPSQAENLEQLKETVLQTGADLGIAFDGDGDRLAVIDQKGEIWGSELLLFLYVQQILQSNPKATIITDVKVTETLINFIKKNGGHVIISPTGHALIKKKIKETHALFAGEYSGHMFFNDRYYGYDDAIYAALRLCEIIDATPLHQLRKHIPSFYKSPEIPFYFAPSVSRETIINNIKAFLQKQNTPFSTIDGIKVFLPEGWWLIRASNTEDKLVGIVEAYNAKQLELLIEQVKELIETASP